MKWPLAVREGKPPIFLRFRSSPALIITTCSFAVYTDIFLFAVLVPVLPFALSSRANVPEDQVQYWVSISLSVYGAALLASSPIWGYLADRTRNRQIPMVAGLVLLAGATVFLCVGESLALLMIGRALQGLSAALTWTVGLALVVDSVDRQHVGQATGWIGTALSLGILTGPLLGGVVYDKGGYYQVFAMCFGLIALDIVLRLIIIEIKEAKKWLVVDESAGTDSKRGEAIGGVTSDANNTDHDAERGQSQTISDSERPENASHQPETGSLSGAKRKMGGMLSILRKPRLLAALWGTFVEAVIQTGLDSTLPLFVSSLFGWDSTGAGLVFLPLVLPTFLSPLVGIVGDRYGPKWLSTIGFLFVTPFLVCLRFVEEDSMAHKIMLCGLLVGIGLGDACVLGPLMAEMTWAIEEDSPDAAAVPYAMAYGLYNMAFSGGTLVGPIMAGFIRDDVGWPTVGWSLALVTGLTAVTQFLWTGPAISWKRAGR